MANIIIRNATPEDVPLVTRVTMAAVGLYDFSYLVPDNIEIYNILAKVCGHPDTLYSYTNARVVFLGETAVGCLISYPGEFYLKSREFTFQMSEFDGSGTEMEAEAGEYYLDSLAILPAFRGNSIGKVLIMDAIDRAVSLGYKRVSLLVEKDHPRLHDYYESMGFKDVRELMAFNEPYVKMSFDC